MNSYKPWEIIFKDLISDYLSQTKNIEIFTDGSASVFNHRAEVITNDGRRLYLTIKSKEKFIEDLETI